MKIILDIPDNTRALVVTGLHGSIWDETMTSRGFGTEQLKSGAEFNLIVEEENENEENT